MVGSKRNTDQLKSRSAKVDLTQVLYYSRLFASISGKKENNGNQKIYSSQSQSLEPGDAVSQKRNEQKMG